MPYKIYQIPGGTFVRVVNTDTGMVHSKHTTLKKAQAQIRLLHAKEAKPPFI